MRSSSREQLRASLPDTPRHVEARDLLAWRDSQVRGEPGAFVVWSVEDDLAVVVGRPGGAVLEETFVCSELVLLEEPRSALDGFAVEGATVLEKRDRWPPRTRHATRPLRGAELEGLDPGLRAELEDAMEEVTILAALDGQQPVAFAYPASVTESLWDVSIDTLATHRRRGFARSAVTALGIEMDRLGKRAVWGAADSNPASLALARSLGFEAVDRIWVASRR